MTLRRSRIAFALLITVAMISTSCSQPSPIRPFAIVPVTITNCVADPDSAPPVHYSAGDQVNWSADGTDYTITFSDSLFNPKPFDGSPFKVPMNGSVPSGAVNFWGKACVFVHAGSCSYKYTISGNNGGCPKDPIVIIDK
jgi:hypothetical protein